MRVKKCPGAVIRKVLKTTPGCVNSYGHELYMPLLFMLLSPPLDPLGIAGLVFEIIDNLAIRKIGLHKRL